MPKSAPTGGGPLTSTTVTVDGVGHVLVGAVTGGTISTEGIVTATSISGATEITAGVYLHVARQLTGADGEHISVRSPLVYAGFDHPNRLLRQCRRHPPVGRTSPIPMPWM